MTDPLEALNALLDQYRDNSPPRTDPIRLTRAQFDQLRAEAPPVQQPDPAAWLYGVDIVLVDNVSESTPYLEGWIKCPWCQMPMVDHSVTACTAQLTDPNPYLPAGVGIAWKDSPCVEFPVGPLHPRMRESVDPLTPGTDTGSED